MNKTKKSGEGWETLLCALCYLFPVWVFGLFFIRRSKRIHFHVFQAVNLSLSMAIYFLAAAAAGFGINLISWRYSQISGILSGAVLAGYILLGLLAVSRVIKRNNRPLPFVFRIVKMR